MVEAVVCLAVERLGELLVSEANFLYGVNHKIGEVQRELKRMQHFLNEADKKQSRDERLRGYVGEIGELAFKIEDVIETFAMEVASEKQKSGFKEMLRRFACIVGEGVSLHKIGKEINTIKGELTNLTASLPTYGITRGLEGETSNSMNLKNKRIFYSHDIEKDFVGMKKEIEELISHLKMEENGCEVLSICGMGGQGKTTLVTEVYNHANVQAHFKAFAWVSITQQFERDNVLRDILKQLLPAGRANEISQMDDAKVVQELYKVQQEGNCLVVMDDMWTLDVWRSLRPGFPIANTASGSKILITTRNEKVADVGSSVYKLPGLTEDEGWQLLSKKAFRGVNDFPEEMVTSEMERIGKNMVKRCKGLPLAVSALGGILKGKMLREWEVINKDISFHLALARGEADEYYTVTQVLGLSYDSLTPRSKHCFLCLGKYREAEEIQVEELYLFWIAEGLISIEDKAEGEMMLDVAERYLEDLAHKNLVQVVPWDFEGESWSKYRTCRVHDLVRDLCLSKVKEENFLNMPLQLKPLLLDRNSKASVNRVRRLCIRLYSVSTPEPVSQHLIARIRSLFLDPDRFIRKWPEAIPSLHKFKLLRVLTVSNLVVNEEMFRSIAKLVYLKYLTFNGSSLHGDVPSTIGNLRNLVILDLRAGYNITIPNVLWKLKQLKYLYLPKNYNEGYSKQGEAVETLRLDGLNELELLHNFDSNYCDGHDLVQLNNIKVVTGIIRLHGKVNENLLLYFINSKDMRHSNLTITGEAGISCLVSLLNCSFIGELAIQIPITVLPKEYDRNRFSRCLTRLHLRHCRFKEDPMILVEKLPNLRYLYLGQESYIGAEMVCSATGFPALQTLDLSYLGYLTKLKVEKGAMPNLSHLKIGSCCNLEMLPDGLKFLNALKILDISYMHSLFIDKYRVTNGVEGEDFHKVSHISKLILSIYVSTVS